MAIPTVSGGIFNFTTGGYTPPSFSGSTYNFGEGETFYQVWTDDYVYAATSLGLKIYNISTENEYAYIDYTGGFSTIWANDEKVFVGTASGVKYIEKTCISGANLYVCLEDLSYDLTHDNVIYLHGYEDKLLCITESGVDVIKLAPQSYQSSTTLTGVRKGFMTSTGKFYYMTADVLYITYTSLFDWTEANKRYTVGSGIFESGVELNDLFVTEQTASDGTSNVIFVATTSGAYIIDEGSDDYVIYYTE